MAKKEKAVKTKEPGIYQLSDGRYLLRVTVPHHEDRARMIAVRRTLPEGYTLAQAAVARDSLRDQTRARAAGEDAASAPLRHTLASYTVCWIRAKRERVRAGVLKTYCTQLERHILPELGDLYVDALVRADVEAWVAQAERAQREDGEPYSRYTVMGWWDLLRMVLRDACADLQLPIDPTARVRGPQVRVARKREQGTLSLAELGRLLDAAQTFCPQRHAEIVVLAYTGMRVGELYGLKWEDLDRSGASLTVRRSVSDGVVGLPKTGDARVVYAPPIVLDALETHRLEQLAAQHPGLAEGWIFPAAHGGPRDGASLRAPLALASEGAKLSIKVGPQILRRTFNTLLIGAGVDKLVLRAQMGHSSERIQERYTGFSVADKRAAVTRGLGLGRKST